MKGVWVQGIEMSGGGEGASGGGARGLDAARGSRYVYDNTKDRLCTLCFPRCGWTRGAAETSPGLVSSQYLVEVLPADMTVHPAFFSRVVVNKLTHAC